MVDRDRPFRTVPKSRCWLDPRRATEAAGGLRAREAEGAEPGLSNHNSVPLATRFVAPALRQTASMRDCRIDADWRRFRRLSRPAKLDSARPACTGDGAIGIGAAIRLRKAGPMGSDRASRRPSREN